MSIHKQSAERHLATAARWEERGDAERADFERRCATLEGELARLEADRADLEGLRDAWLTRPSEDGRVEIQHYGEEIAGRPRSSKHWMWPLRRSAPDCVMNGSWRSRMRSGR